MAFADRRLTLRGSRAARRQASYSR